MRYVTVLLLLLSTREALADRPTDVDMRLLPDRAGAMTIVDEMMDGEFTSTPSWPILARYVYTKNVNEPMRYDAELNCDHADATTISCDAGEKKTMLSDRPVCYAPSSKGAATTARWVSGRLECTLSARKHGLVDDWAVMKAAVASAIDSMTRIQKNAMPAEQAREHAQKIAQARELAKHGRR